MTALEILGGFVTEATALVVRLIFGLQPDGESTSSAPELWGAEAHLDLPDYPRQRANPS